MRRNDFISGSVVCVMVATTCAALDVATAATPIKIIRRLPPVEPPRSAVFSIDDIAATNEQQLTLEESFGHVLEVTKNAPDSPTVGGWIDAGYNSGSSGWSINY